MCVGRGNLGGGVALAVMPACFDSLIRQGYDINLAWRYSVVWPPATLLFCAACIYLFTDDSPQGRFLEVHKAKKARAEADPSCVLAHKVCRHDGFATGACGSTRVSARPAVDSSINDTITSILLTPRF